MPAGTLDLGYKTIKDRDLREIIRKLPKNIKNKITAINLSGAERITDKGLKYLGKLRHLKHLDLSGCKKITNEGLYALRKPRLTHLNLSMCVNISDLGLSYLSYFGELPLEFLSLKGCIRVTNKGINWLRKMPLKELDLSVCPKITGLGLRHLQALPLQSLKLGYRYSLTDADLYPLRGMTLTSLDLQYCPKITSKGLSYLDRLPLNDLNLEGCGKIETNPSAFTWEGYLARNSAYILGNPNEAQILFIGDDHTDKSLRAFRSAIIEHSANDGDIVVVEEVQSLKQVEETNLNEWSLKKKLQVYGWDDLDTYNEMRNLLGKTSGSSRFWLFQPSQSKKLKAERDRLRDLRNNSLIRTVTKLHETGKKIFVIAGTFHLYNKEKNYCVLDAFKGTGIRCALIEPTAKQTYLNQNGRYAKRLVQKQQMEKDLSRGIQKRDELANLKDELQAQLEKLEGQSFSTFQEQEYLKSKLIRVEGYLSGILEDLNKLKAEFSKMEEEEENPI